MRILGKPNRYLFDPIRDIDNSNSGGAGRPSCPTKLYGREHPLAELIEIFQRVVSGGQR